MVVLRHNKSSRWAGVKAYGGFSVITGTPEEQAGELRAATADPRELRRGAPPPAEPAAAEAAESDDAVQPDFLTGVGAGVCGMWGLAVVAAMVLRRRGASP